MANDAGLLRCGCGGSVRMSNADQSKGVEGLVIENYECVVCRARGTLTIYPDGSSKREGCIS